MKISITWFSPVFCHYISVRSNYFNNGLKAKRGNEKEEELNEGN